MDNTCPCNVSQQGVPAYPQQYPPQQTCLQAPAAANPPVGGPLSCPSAQPAHMAYAAGPSQAWQQAPSEQYPLHPGPQEQQHMQPMQQQPMQQQNMYSTQSLPQQAPHQHQQQQHQQDYCQQDSQAAAAAVAAGPDDSRGLGSTLGSAAHKVHKVELAMHHMAHPVQGLKHHTVDKVKRKVKAKVCGLVDKVLP